MSARTRKKKRDKPPKTSKVGKGAPGDTVEADSPEAPAPEEFEILREKARERDEYLDRLQRTSADFANYQKRMQREVEETRKYAAGPVALDLLGVIDNIHRAIEAASGRMDEGFLDGFKMIEEQLMDTLKKQGVAPIEALEQPFDPNFHEALMEIEDETRPDKTVVEELEKGYMIHDRLLRPARVRVSRDSSREDKKADAGPKDGTK
jgi:molecular chaperone GrpE